MSPMLPLPLPPLGPQVPVGRCQVIQADLARMADSLAPSLSTITITYAMRMLHLVADKARLLNDTSLGAPAAGPHR